LVNIKKNEKMEMKKYQFTADWFGSTDEISKILPIGTTQKLEILEIGSYEGRSTIWFLENLLNNKESYITCVDPWQDYSQDKESLNSYNSENAEWKFEKLKIFDKFLYNVEISEQKEKFEIKKGLSTKILPELINQNRQFDVIFIDGNHVAPSVLMDTVLCWNLLKKDGILIFDDYLWMPHLDKTLTPKLAIDSFLEIFEGYYEPILDSYRKAIKKIN